MPEEDAERSTRIQPLPEGLVSALGMPDAYPNDESARGGVAAVQTHISHVFLTPTRVYKVRKAVNPGFLDFGTRAARNADCEREVILNRRFASDVYLGLAEVREGPCGVRVGPLAESIRDQSVEHCVVMRRLPDGRDALSLSNRGGLEPSHIDEIARVVNRVHRRHGLGRPAPFDPGEWLRALSGPVEDNFALLEASVDDDRPAVLARAARNFLTAHADRFEIRRRDGRAVDGHGDLHLAHVWFEAADRDPLFVDCIEFSERLRRIDAASDVAFLAMDLIYRNCGSLADRFLRRYAESSGDFHLYAVVDYFISYRAGVRAKVAALASAESEIPEAQRQAARQSLDRHLDLAIQALVRQRNPGIVVMTGVVGTGKSSAADIVAETVGGAAVIASDRVRKQMAGLAADDHRPAPVDDGMYSRNRTAEVYAALLAHAQPLLSAGRVAILDATFSQRAQREAAIEFMQRRGIPGLFVETRCGEATVLDRLHWRQQQGHDASDAGPDFYRTSVSRFDPVVVPDPFRHVVVDTDVPGWRQDLAQQVGAWRDETLRETT